MADDDKTQKPPLPPGMGAKPPLPGMGAKPPLPGMGAKPPMPPGGGMPGMPPGMPSIPGLTGPSGAPRFPTAPGVPMNTPPLPGMTGLAPTPPMPGMPGMPGMTRPGAPVDEKAQLEKKLADLEKRLAEEREKMLVASVKQKEEQANAAKVEVSIKEMQDRLRRDRRDQENEESRLKLEAKLQEMEQRLSQERETWVVTLKNQLNSRQTQDKEIETHFAMRVQEMERRWLEEKAQWQKIAGAKDEEIRNLRSLAEKLKGADVELSKALSEKKWLETRVSELSHERAEASARILSAAEREKEAIQLRGEIQLTKQQMQMLQDRLERDVLAVRMSAKEREERLLADHERLQRDLASVNERKNLEIESQVRRVKAEADAEMTGHKQLAERAALELQKLRGVAGALERQLAASKAQSSGWERTQERYKAEFVVLQRKWVEREKEIRAESDARALQMLEAEKAKIKVLAQDEINHRVSRLAEQMQKENGVELQRAQASVRLEVERVVADRVRALQADWDQARRTLEAEIERLHQDLFRKESEWAKRGLSKESEAAKVAATADELAAKLRVETSTRQAYERQKLELEKTTQDMREQVARLQAELDQARRGSEGLSKERSNQTQRLEELERLTTAQAAQVQNLQSLLDQARSELSREVHLARLHLGKEEKAAGPQDGGLPAAPSVFGNDK